LRVVLTDVRRHCRCHCPAIAGKLRGHDARYFAGCLHLRPARIPGL
jgi:hypothetical protein